MWRARNDSNVRFGLAEARRKARSLISDLEAGKAPPALSRVSSATAGTIRSMMPRYLRSKEKLRSFQHLKSVVNKYILPLKREEAERWALHDIRRRVATGLQRLGMRFEVTEAILNHVSGAKGGIAGVYQRHDWKAEKRSALNAWAKHLAGIVRKFDLSTSPMARRAKAKSMQQGKASRNPGVVQ